MKTAFTSQSGSLSSKRLIGVLSGLVYILIQIVIVFCDLSLGLVANKTILDSVNGLGYLATALLTATVAEPLFKKLSKNE